MKKILWLGMCVVAGLGAGPGWGQEAVITSFRSNGVVTWTNTANTNSLYRVEWAPEAGGPWYRTFDNIGSLDGLDRTSFAAQVPMFYRVVMTTNQPPQGMAWIEGGDAVLGQAGIATPVHTNFVSGFWMDEMEVTKAKWDQVHAWATNCGYAFDHAGLGKASNHPVHDVSWYDCVKWCNARSQMEGLLPCYYTSADKTLVLATGTHNISNQCVKWDANGYRLPTEAEWEKAARGGRQGRLFPWGGDKIQHARANYIAQAGVVYDTSPTLGYHPSYTNPPLPYTSPAGSFPANGYGLHDMAGNIMEWGWDWNGAYAAGYATDPRGAATGTARIARGGSWVGHADISRCAMRLSYAPASSGTAYGFRCVRGP